jgi:outer membrane receptor for monomeric catechols
VNSGSGQLSPYDIKAEKDDYFELGVAQQFWNSHVVSLNTYYKMARNMLDDAQLLNTSIAQPYNFSNGYAYGAELSLKGQINDEFSDFANYTYEIAKGRGISGGIFAFPVNQLPPNTYQFLDHVQVHTATAGINYNKNHFTAGLNALYGSGLRTAPNNTGHLPGHLSFDLTAGYALTTGSWWRRWSFSGDILNVLNNVYPITVANGFNGSHYSAGREYFIRVAKDL